MLPIFRVSSNASLAHDPIVDPIDLGYISVNLAPMNTRYLSAKLFWGLAVLSFILGVVLLRRGLTLVDYLNPLFLLFLPRLIPFGVAVLSIAFGLVYLVVERDFRRPPSVPLTVAHLTFFLLAIFGHIMSVHFIGRALSERHLQNPPMPLWGTGLFLFAFGASLVFFAMNIIRSARRTPLNV
ncbi:MAG TPA: hypothetical protein VGR72_14125 [Candidatus Acidoferrales bacterium]|nr:hypothetical protein [Candidatus Acidoferrales bacterium]